MSTTRLTRHRSIEEAMKMLLKVTFDKDSVSPGKESFDLFADDVVPKFKELLTELNIIVRGGYFDDYASIFEDIKKIVVSPDSFMKAGTLDLEHDPNRTFIIDFIHYGAKAHVERILFFLDKGFAIYANVKEENREVGDFYVNGTMFDMSMLAEEDQENIVKQCFAIHPVSMK